MEDEPIKETVEKPETVNPAPEHVNPPVNPEHGHDEIEDLKSRLSAAEATLQSLTAGQGEPDTKPVAKPWTHWSGKKS